MNWAHSSNTRNIGDKISWEIEKKMWRKFKQNSLPEKYLWKWQWSFRTSQNTRKFFASRITINFSEECGGSTTFTGVWQNNYTFFLSDGTQLLYEGNTWVWCDLCVRDPKYPLHISVVFKWVYMSMHTCIYVDGLDYRQNSKSYSYMSQRVTHVE